MILIPLLFVAEIIPPKSLDQALTVAVAGLGVAIVAMWRFMLKEFAECKKDRELLRKMITDRVPMTCSVKNCSERVPMPAPFFKQDGEAAS